MTDFNRFENECKCGRDDNENDCCCRRRCIDWIFVILSVLFAFSLGLLIGALFFAILLIALPALISTAVILGILTILSVIARKCTKRNCDSE